MPSVDRMKRNGFIGRPFGLLSLRGGMTVLLYVFAPIYAENISHGGPDATLATRAIAPAMLFFPLIAIMRGYFQGRQHMMPNGISQVVEQIFRLITSIALAYFLLNISAGLGCRRCFLRRGCRRRLPHLLLCCTMG